MSYITYTIAIHACLPYKNRETMMRKIWKQFDGVNETGERREKTCSVWESYAMHDDGRTANSDGAERIIMANRRKAASEKNWETQETRESEKARTQVEIFSPRRRTPSISIAASRFEPSSGADRESHLRQVGLIRRRRVG